LTTGAPATAANANDLSVHLRKALENKRRTFPRVLCRILLPHTIPLMTLERLSTMALATSSLTDYVSLVDTITRGLVTASAANYIIQNRLYASETA
jgi:hypothetical protein